jgi:hypothetical protein
MSSVSTGRKLRCPLSYEQIELTRVETGIAIMFPSQLEKSESVLVSSEATVCGLIEIDETAFHHEKRDHRFW